jgi:hypothetical protein
LEEQEMVNPKKTDAEPLEILSSEKKRPKKVFVPHVATEAPVAPPPSDTEIPREVVNTDATWRAGPARDPQLDPVDAINPVNVANPAGAISEPVSIEGLAKGRSGMSLGLVIGVIVVAIGLAIFWFLAVDFNLMGGPTLPN